jgi:hypothetical protein
MSIRIEYLKEELDFSLNELIKDYLSAKIMKKEVFYDDTVQFKIKEKKFDCIPQLDLESIEIDRDGRIRFSAISSDSELIIKLGDLNMECMIDFDEEKNEYKDLRILTMHEVWKEKNCGD